ncbi:NAD(P)-dependent oxidoreductase, partial [Achromobacter spanius]|uniref:NAD(P)-dependent oxidoreductase n=1 Tax=Achromobacter spanius TaxID=217203 RepID=UPI003A91CA1B
PRAGAACVARRPRRVLVGPAPARSGQLGGAALDVFDIEPLAPAPHFQACPNLILTPHTAGLTTESNQRVSSLVAEKVLAALG